LGIPCDERAAEIEQLKAKICALEAVIVELKEKIARLENNSSTEGLVNRLPQEAHIHLDETGWKENGKRRWIWAFKTNRYAIFRIKATRGEVEDTLGKSFAGTISCDFYSSYRKATILVCLAMLLGAYHRGDTVSL
jgi:hypothetical protein